MRNSANTSINPPHIPGAGQYPGHRTCVTPYECSCEMTGEPDGREPQFQPRCNAFSVSYETPIFAWLENRKVRLSQLLQYRPIEKTRACDEIGT